MIDNGVGLALHTYEPDEEGRCKSGWYNIRNEWITCRSRQRSSVLHDDPESDFRQLHDHGGGDCMCFEDADGPSWSDALAAYIANR